MLHQFCLGKDIIYTGKNIIFYPQVSMPYTSLFLSENTKAGKTLPPCLFPYPVEELNSMLSLDFVRSPKCLLLTALNSIRDSLAQKLQSLGLGAEILSVSNADEILESKEAKIILVSPEVLKQNSVIHALLSVRDSFVVKCVDEAHLFMQWGVAKKGCKTFRPAMQLSTGELSSLGGITLLQTATATCKTIRVLEEEFPEVKNWSRIIHLPYRQNISIIIPPPNLLPSRFQSILAPFVKRIIDFEEPHLIITRSINVGIEVYFHLLRALGSSPNCKSVALYHRSVSEKRKQEILSDLSLSMQSPQKKLKAVVATISLGVGVDIRVKNVVCLGHGSTPENMIQEAGRS